MKIHPAMEDILKERDLERIGLELDGEINIESNIVLRLWYVDDSEEEYANSEKYMNSISCGSSWEELERRILRRILHID